PAHAGGPDGDVVAKRACGDREGGLRSWHATADRADRAGRFRRGSRRDDRRGSECSRDGGRSEPASRATDVPASTRGGTTLPRVAVQTAHDNRTMTAQRFKRRPPMWVVAALSCSIALLIAGVVIAILSTTTGPSSSTKPQGSNGSAAVGSAGPFTSARSAFNS